MDTRFMLFLVLTAITGGCASLTGAPSVVKTACSYEQAWAVSLASVDEFELRDVDKANGVIATEWLDFPSRRKAGAFSRDANRERARFFLNLKPSARTVEISVHQMREFFSPMGLQSQSTGWRRIPPVTEEEGRLAGRITKKLMEKGCAIVG